MNFTLIGMAIASLRRWLNSDAVRALAYTAGVVSVLGSIVWAHGSGVEQGRAELEARYKAADAARSAAIAKQQLEDAKQIIEATEKAREQYEAERDAAIERAAELERKLQTVTSQTGDPVVIPESLAKELNK